MKVMSIKQARFIALFDLDELMPLGLVSMSKIVPAITSRFEFQKVRTPKDGRDQDSFKGLEFTDGIWNGTPVSRLAIFNDGIIVETRIATSRSKEIFVESMDWARSELGLDVPEDVLRRPRYVSILTFQSDAPILAPSKAERNLADHMTRLLGSITGLDRKYVGTRIDVDFDRTTDKEPIAGLTIQPLALEPFQFKRYFSQAPLPTEEHIDLLEQFEADIFSAEG